MKNLKSKVFVFWIICPFYVFSQEGKIKAFLKCNCDARYIQQNTLFIDYVRDQNLSDLEIFVFEITSGSGGTEYTFNFYGKKKLNNRKNSLVVFLDPSLTSNERREKLLKTYVLGLAYMLQGTAYQDNFEVKYNLSEKSSYTSSFDKWKNWVFEISGSFDFEDEKSINEKEYRLDFEIDRVTDLWRVRSDFGIQNNVKTFLGDEESYNSVRNRTYFSGSLVRSISDHFSTGIFGSFEEDTFRNFKSFLNFSPALEYNIFPYREVLNREITFAYKIGYSHYKYIEETIYGYLNEKQFVQSLTLNLRYRKNWGGIYSYLAASQFLNSQNKNRLTFNNYLNLRIIQGLALRVSGRFQLIRDQINLPKGEVSIEDLLLRQRQIATNFQNTISLGLSYTFGSIFNNIVNTRL